MNSSHCRKRARRAGGDFCTLGAFESHFSGPKIGFVSPSVTCDHCDLSSNPVGL